LIGYCGASLPGNRNQTEQSVSADAQNLKWREGEGRTITASSHNPKDHPGPIRTSGLHGSTESAQEGNSDDASDSISGAIEAAKSCGGNVETTFSIVLGVQGYPNSTLPKSAKCFVSAAGFEPATHALKASPN
jgi:hypothetical protein